MARMIRTITGMPTAWPIFAAKEIEESEGLATEEVEVGLLVEVVVVSLVEVSVPPLAEKVVVHVLEDFVVHVLEDVLVHELEDVVVHELEDVVLHVLDEVIDRLAEVVAVSPIGATAVVMYDCKPEVAIAEKPLCCTTPNSVKVPRSIT